MFYIIPDALENKNLKGDMIGYLELTDPELLQDLYNQSDAQTVIIFKHTTRCPISTAAADEMDKLVKDPPENTIFARILVVENRPVSLKIAEDLVVQHESPQVIICRNKKVLFYTSHRDITEDRVRKEIK